MIAFQWNKRSLYMIIRNSSRTWWVMLIIGNNDNPSEKDEKHIHPRFRRVRLIQWVEGRNVLICDCGYFYRIGLPCGHLFHVKGNICLTDCDIMWYKSYNYHFGRIPRYTQQVSQIINHVKVVGVPFVASPPTIVSAVYTNCTDLRIFIPNCLTTINNRICCSNSISHHTTIHKQPIAFSLGSIQKPDQFCRVRPKSEQFPWIVVE
jgi:hypothetical protein